MRNKKKSKKSVGVNQFDKKTNGGTNDTMGVFGKKWTPNVKGRVVLSP
jgi:hypothetical protein